MKTITYGIRKAMRRGRIVFYPLVDERIPSSDTMNYKSLKGAFNSALRMALYSAKMIGAEVKFSENQGV